jgi:hypothetical protein
MVPCIICFSAIHGGCFAGAPRKIKGKDRDLRDTRRHIIGAGKLYAKPGWASIDQSIDWHSTLFPIQTLKV